jgi:tRNA A-37 threonylcarbamoyl transferase component Bud32
VLAQASVPTEGAKGQTAPSREEVAAAFPQLEILELIGQGGMGFVFKARQPKLERLVALKILPQALAADPAFAERFTREGRVLARLNHPNIVAIHDFGQAGNFFYLLMEFVDGVNLRQAMRAGRFTPAQALAVVPKICEALQFAHDEGILHRDIKPENILVDVRGRVKIADFGIAKLLEDAKPGLTLTGSGATLGTPHYMAPEQLEKPGTVDHRADIYSLGVVFYEMLTGELPLGRFQPPSQKVEMDVRLDEVVLHALEKEPARRYQQASQVKTAVETIASGAAAPAQAAPAPPGQFPKRKESELALAGSALAMCLACFGMFLAIEGESVPVVVVVGLFSSLLVLLVFAWDEFLKKTSAQTIAGGTAAAAPASQAPRSDHFWRRMTLAIGVLCLVLILILIVFRFAPVLHRTNQREADEKPSWWDDVPAETKAYVAAQKALATVPPPFVPDGGTEMEAAQMVIETSTQVPWFVAPGMRLGQRTFPDEHINCWRFNYLIPAGQMAQLVFVYWSNGVPSIWPGLSGYFKIGQKPVVLPNVIVSCGTNGPVSDAGTNGTHGASLDLPSELLAKAVRGRGTNEMMWGSDLGWDAATAEVISNGSEVISNQSTYRVLTPAPRSILHSGHQLAIRLAEFDPPAGSASNGWSGVELRLILQPLTSPAVVTDFSEHDGTNYVSGFGLDGASETTILKMIKDLPFEAQPVEKGP